MLPPLSVRRGEVTHGSTRALRVRPVHHACTRACALQVTLDHAACLALCASCANCRFASVSRAHRQHGQTFPRSRPASYAPCGHTAHHPRGPTACSGALRSSRGPSCPCCPGPRRQPSGRGRRRVETAAAFRPCPRSLNLRRLCLSTGTLTIARGLRNVTPLRCGWGRSTWATPSCTRRMRFGAVLRPSSGRGVL